MDREKVIKGWECHMEADTLKCADCPYREGWRTCNFADTLFKDVYALLKEQEELLRKLQNDKDKLCIEVSKWKHKFHDAPPKFVSQGVVDQIRWERDTALSQLEQIGKGLGSKMDDIVTLLKEQEAVKPIKKDTVEITARYEFDCPCGAPLLIGQPYCADCGRSVKWE